MPMPLPIHSNVTQVQVREAREWHPVTSTRCRSVCWRQEKGLGIWFRASGKQPEVVCWYPSQGINVFLRMLTAPSKGRFVAFDLKGVPYDGPFPPPG
jgi:hypothetical protein